MKKDYNGKVSPMSIIALVLSILGCTSLIGVVLGIVDVTKNDGRKKWSSITAIVVGSLLTIIVIAALASGSGDKKTEKMSSVDKREEVTEEAKLEEPPLELPKETNQPVNDVDALKKELKEKYDVDEPSKFVSGDTTGKWRIVKVANATAPYKYAVEYAKAYMQDADMTSIHYIVNFSLNTTTKLQIIDNRLCVTTTEYVEKEEHDASVIGNGLLYMEQYYDMNTGEEINTQADPDAGTVDKDELISAVEKAIDGAVAEDEKITGVDFDGENLTVTVDLSSADTSILSADLIAESRTGSITDDILGLEDKYYNTWETVTVDFGNVGKISFNKGDVKDSSFGKYFEVPIDCFKK